MTFEEADILCDLAVEGFYRAGGAYDKVTSWRHLLEYGIITCLALDQYVVKYGKDGKLAFFATFFKLDDEELELALECKTKSGTAYPDTFNSGSNLYIAEAFVDREAGGVMKEMVREIYRRGRPFTGVYWHRVSRHKLRKKSFPKHC